MSLNAQSLSEDLWTAYEDERLMNKLQNVRLRIKDRELQKKDQELEALRVAMLALTREVECQRESLESEKLLAFARRHDKEELNMNGEGDANSPLLRRRSPTPNAVSFVGDPSTVITSGSSTPASHFRSGDSLKPLPNLPDTSSIALSAQNTDNSIKLNVSLGLETVSIPNPLLPEENAQASSASSSPIALLPPSSSKRSSGGTEGKSKKKPKIVPEDDIILPDGTTMPDYYHWNPKSSIDLAGTWNCRLCYPVCDSLGGQQKTGVKNTNRHFGKYSCDHQNDYPSSWTKARKHVLKHLKKGDVFASIVVAEAGDAPSTSSTSRRQELDGNTGSVDIKVNESQSQQYVRARLWERARECALEFERTYCSGGYHTPPQLLEDIVANQKAVGGIFDNHDNGVLASAEVLANLRNKVPVEVSFGDLFEGYEDSIARVRAEQAATSEILRAFVSGFRMSEESETKEAAGVAAWDW